MKRRKGQCILLVTAPPNMKWPPEYRGPYVSPTEAKDRAAEMEEAGEIGFNWWLFPLSPP